MKFVPRCYSFLPLLVGIIAVAAFASVFLQLYSAPFFEAEGFYGMETEDDEETWSIFRFYAGGSWPCTLPAGPA